MASSRWSLRNIYMYLVCLITLIMVIVAVVGLVRSGVELVYPDPSYIGTRPVDEKGNDLMTEEEWQKQQEAAEASSRRYAVLNLVGNVAMLLVAGPLYVYHWRKIEVEKGESAEAPVPAVPAPPA